MLCTSVMYFCYVLPHCLVLKGACQAVSVLHSGKRAAIDTVSATFNIARMFIQNVHYVCKKGESNKEKCHNNKTELYFALTFFNID